MSGAYVAKPAVVVASDYPPGWKIDWPFPGAFPPGYEPSYSIVISAPLSVNPGQTATAIVTVYDHGTYRTSAPSGALSLTGLLDGDENEHVGASSFSIDGDLFYSGSVEVSTQASDAGKTINWSASSDPFGLGTVLQNESSTVINTVSMMRVEVTLTATATSTDDANAAAGFNLSDGVNFCAASISNGNGVDDSTSTGDGDVGIGHSTVNLPVAVGVIEQNSGEIVYTLNIGSLAASSAEGANSSVSSTFVLRVLNGSEEIFSESYPMDASSYGVYSESYDRSFTITTHGNGTCTVSEE
jgi:hypothetical protein